MEKVIDLKSREYNNYLKRLESASGKVSMTYLLKVGHPSLIVETDLTSRIVAIEPRGGPVIRVGSTLPDVGEVEYIDYVLGCGYTITFKK